MIGLTIDVLLSLDFPPPLSKRKREHYQHCGWSLPPPPQSPLPSALPLYALLMTAGRGNNNKVPPVTGDNKGVTVHARPHPASLPLRVKK